MKLRILLLLLMLAVTAGLKLAIAQTDNQGAQGTDELKALMLKTMQAWATLDPANAAQFYDTEGKHVFYDSSPLKYVGWNEYTAGSRKVFATLKSVKMAPEDDIQTHRRGDVAWGTATFQFEIVPKEGPLYRSVGKARRQVADRARARIGSEGHASCGCKSLGGRHESGLLS